MMANTDSFTARWTPRLLSVLRIVTAFLFMAHGAQKLFGYPAAPPPTPEQKAAQECVQNCPKPPQPPTPSWMGTLMTVAGVLEFFGGLLFLLGLFTRPVAFVLSGLMAAAYFMGHAPGGFWPVINKGELAVLYCFVFLFFVAAGGGLWSVDWCIRRSRAADADVR